MRHPAVRIQEDKGKEWMKMSFLEHLDWPLVSFVGVSLMNDYFAMPRFPQIHYWKTMRLP